MISDTEGFIFVHRGKSGGNSITKSLLPYCEDERIIGHNSFQDGINYFDVINQKYSVRKHASIAEIHQRISNRMFGSFYKFSIIRNPYERLISVYFSPNRVYNKNVESFDATEFEKVIKSQRTFREFVCIDPKENLLAHMDTVLRFENLNEDFSILCSTLRLKVKTLAHLNKSKRKADYREYYNDKLIDLVESKFREEIDFFNYKF